ncbi:polysaccharide biosynthesis protein [Alphaproteobacteria bacterium]|nr:polysaccharide biosynthesis protein [Alphaproteobacteria bacterium]
MITEKTILNLLDRKNMFFEEDYNANEGLIENKIKNSKIIVIGGAGSIGSSAVKLLLNYEPLLLHIIDINENKLVELVRYVRSSIGYTKGVFETFPIDVGSKTFEAFINSNEGYDVWLNFSALKHVRSERDPFTLMRMLEVNFENTYKMLKIAKNTGAKEFFSVSTDKACDPVNFLGASKRLMEFALSCFSKELKTSSARFGNVAFSDGSLLFSALNRLENLQPLVAPVDIKRYFITHEEAAKLSLMATFCSQASEIYVPKIKKSEAQKDFPSIIEKLLRFKGYKMHITKSESEARLIAKNRNSDSWPCYLFNTDTSGEKDEEVFLGVEDLLIENSYKEIEVINTENLINEDKLRLLLNNLNKIKENKLNGEEIKKLIKKNIKNFNHNDKPKSLEEKM